MNVILKIITLGQTVPLRSLAQSGEVPTAGDTQRAHGASPHSQPAAPPSAQAFPAAVGPWLLRGSASLSGERNPNSDLSGVWRVHGRGAQVPARLTGKVVEGNTEMQVAKTLEHEAPLPTILILFQVTAAAIGHPLQISFSSCFGQFLVWGEGTRSVRKRTPLEPLAPGLELHVCPTWLLTRCQQEWPELPQKPTRPFWWLQSGSVTWIQHTLHRRALSPREPSSWKQRDTPSAWESSKTISTQFGFVFSGIFCLDLHLISRNKKVKIIFLKKEKI